MLKDKWVQYVWACVCATVTALAIHCWVLTAALTLCWINLTDWNNSGDEIRFSVILKVFGRIIITFGQVGQMPRSPSTHEAEVVDWHNVRHMGVAEACAWWPVAERPNVFHISTATVACLHLLHSKMDPSLYHRMLSCSCLCCRLCMNGHTLHIPKLGQEINNEIGLTHLFVIFLRE